MIGWKNWMENQTEKIIDYHCILDYNSRKGKDDDGIRM